MDDSSVVATTGPMKAAPIRAELTNPMASPDARCAIAATESGNTGAMHSTCRKRSTPKLHTLPATPSAATSTEEPSRNQISARRSPTTSARRGAAIAPSAAASPVIRRRNPPTSSVASPDTPSGGRICGRIAARKKICVDPVSTTQARRHQLARRRPPVARGPGVARLAGRHAPGHEGRAGPQHHAAQDEGQLEPEARRHHRAHRRPQHLPQRHARLDVGHLTPHVAAGPPHHDEGEGGDRAHEPQEHAGDQHLGQRARERHAEEAQPLERLHRHEAALGIDALADAPRDRRGDDRDERADAEDPPGPAERRGRVQRGHLLDVEGQAHVHERPREGAEQHRGRQDPGPGGRRHRQLRKSAAPERRASAVAAHVPAATSTMATTPSAAPGPRPTADCM